MAEQLARPKAQVEVYWFSEQAQGYVTDGALEQFESGRLGFPNSHFDFIFINYFNKFNIYFIRKKIMTFNFWAYIF